DPDHAGGMPLVRQRLRRAIIADARVPLQANDRNDLPSQVIRKSGIGGEDADLHRARSDARNRRRQTLLPARSAHTRSVTSAVVALPPRSGVSTSPAASVRSIASIRRAAASPSPRCSSISAALQKLAIGLATPLPVMSKPEPWIGSNIDGKRRSGSR